MESEPEKKNDYFASLYEGEGMVFITGLIATERKTNPTNLKPCILSEIDEPN